MDRSKKKICEDGPTQKFLRNLKRYRERKGYTRDDLAQKVEISAETLRGYETKERRNEELCKY